MTLSQNPVSRAFAVSHCSRCSDAPLVPPNKRPVMEDPHIVVFNYRCAAGHRWQRVWRKPELERSRIKIDQDQAREVSYRTGQMRRPHLDAGRNPKAAYPSAARADAASIVRSEQTGRPSPRTYRCPACYLWHLAS